MAVSNGLGSEQALAGVTWQAAEMLGIDHRVGRLAAGLDADVVVLDGPPFNVSTKVMSVWVNGAEVNKQ
jgi:imidazolonepropionase-like amidohydrolase